MEILPCPFCGGPGEVHSYYPAWPSNDHTFLKWGVFCHSHCFVHPRVADFYAEGEAIKVWNIRANPLAETPSPEGDRR